MDALRILDDGGHLSGQPPEGRGRDFQNGQISVCPKTSTDMDAPPQPIVVTLCLMRMRWGGLAAFPCEREVARPGPIPHGGFSIRPLSPPTGPLARCTHGPDDHQPWIEQVCQHAPPRIHALSATPPPPPLR